VATAKFIKQPMQPASTATIMALEPRIAMACNTTMPSIRMHSSGSRSILSLQKSTPKRTTACSPETKKIKQKATQAIEESSIKYQEHRK
jgi:hypothetical protein